MSGINFEQDGVKYFIPAVDGTEIWNDGFAKGKADCIAKHFAAIVEGNGTTSITFGKVPFEPDIIEVISCHGLHGEDGKDIKDDIVHLFACDLRATQGVDRLFAFCFTSMKYGASTQHYRTPTAVAVDKKDEKIEVSEDGYITIKNVIGLDSNNNNAKKDGYFGAGVKYICTAIKVSE